MKYNNIVEAKFLERPNRFVSYCEIDNNIEKVHVKNTGKCRELLIQNCTVYLEESDNPNRKTRYSLIAVQKGDRLINMDSQVPNKVVYEALLNGKITLPELNEKIIKIKPETTYENSRFDIYLETENKKAFIEVKGVTLEENDIVMFPDAKTERGVKHINELVKASKEGYLSYVVFVIQMSDVKYFTPNDKMHKELGDALRFAKDNGVNILAYDCFVSSDTIEIKDEVKVIL
ncbi:MAG: DNA/RNA nuclease SfsA [Romboutsia sp.]|nr:DNA/RNA nuclease SfsA [Romboutsia sp.]